MLVGLEARQLAGKAGPEHDTLLELLREQARGCAAPWPRTEHALRLFCEPLEPLLTNWSDVPKQRGRIARSRLIGIWTWLARDFVPEEIRSLDQEVTEALVKGELAAAEAVINRLRIRLVKELSAVLDELRHDERRQRRLAATVGGDAALGDVRDMADALRIAPVVQQLNRRLPATVTLAGDRQAQGFLVVLEPFLRAAAGREAVLLAWAVGRLADPLQALQLLRIADGGRDKPHPVNGSHAAFAELVLFEAEGRAAAVQAGLGEGMLAPAFFHHLAETGKILRRFRLELDLAKDHPWARRLLDIRRGLAASIEPALDAITPQLRQLFKGAMERPIIRPLDMVTHGELMDRIRVMRICEQARDDLALNVALRRVRAHTEAVLEGINNALTESARRGGHTSPLFADYVERIVEVNRALLGDDLARSFKRLVEAAAAGATLSQGQQADTAEAAAPRSAGLAAR